MINYRVDDLDALVAQLKTEGVTIVDSIEDTDLWQVCAYTGFGRQQSAALGAEGWGVGGIIDCNA